MTPGAATCECIRLVREAVYAHRANVGAIRNPDRPDRLPTLDLEDWYRRAGAAVTALDFDRETRAKELDAYAAHGCRCPDCEG